MVNGYHAFHLRCTGLSHKKSGTVCQDFADSRQNADCTLIAVSDGHGGEAYFRSDRGSRFAVDAFFSCARNADFLSSFAIAKNDSERGERIGQLIKSVIARWTALTEEDAAREPLTGERADIAHAYGATLIGAVLTDSCWFALQIGDGRCVLFDKNGEPSQPVPWDDRCFLNVTTSLCDADAYTEFRFAFGSEPPAALFLSSDGVDNSFAGDEKLYDFYRVALRSFCIMSEEEAIGQLSDFLPSLSEKGSGDDLSLAAMIDTKFIRSTPSLWEKQKTARIEILREGDFGADKPSDSYFEKAEIEAAPGEYNLKELGCGGCGEGVRSFEIITANPDKIVLRLGEKTYSLTPEKPVEITEAKEQNSYDGPWWTAYDTLTFRIV